MMKTILPFLCLSAMLWATQPQEDNRPTIEELSETLGHIIGSSIQSPDLHFDIESIIRGIRNGSEGKSAPLTEEEYQAGMALIQEEYFNTLAQKNFDEAVAFLEKNAKNPQVRSLEEGKLQYIILEPGQEPAVESDGSPLIHYTGSYLDGEVFSSSQDTGPITLNLAHTISGFQKGIEGMLEGEKRKLFIHPDLGYGVSGQLPPNILLIFEVEIIKSQTPEDQNLDEEEDQDDEDDDLYENEVLS